jgi:hypothetical protein
MRRPCVAVFLAVALVGAGCSHEKNEDQGGSPPAEGALYGPTVTGAVVASPSLTGQQFARKADAICDRYRAELARLPAPVTNAELIRGARQAARYFGRQRAELAALHPPSKEARAVDRWLLNQRSREQAYARIDLKQDPINGTIPRIEARLKRESIALGMRSCFIVVYRPDTSGPRPNPTGYR